LFFSTPGVTAISDYKPARISTKMFCVALCDKSYKIVNNCMAIRQISWNATCQQSTLLMLPWYQFALSWCRQILDWRASARSTFSLLVESCELNVQTAPTIMPHINGRTTSAFISMINRRCRSLQVCAYLLTTVTRLFSIINTFVLLWPIVHQASR